MNRIAKYSVALFAGLVAVAPAVAGDNSGIVSAVLQPQYWVMALSTIALVGLGVGMEKADAPARAKSTESDVFVGSNASLA